MNRYLVIKAKGGMGNRMLCALTGILYAEATNRVPVVDWTDGAYAEFGVNAFPQFFNNEKCEAMLPLDNEKTVVPRIWKGHLEKSVSAMISTFDPNKHKSFFVHRKYSIDPSQYDYDDDIAVYWSYTERIHRLKKCLVNLNSEWASINKNVILKSTLIRHFPLKTPILNEKEEFKSKYWSNKVIGIHVRFTDRRIAIKKIETPLRQMLAKFPEASIFLATDNFEVDRYLKTQYPNIISTKKWYPDEFGALHQNTECPDRVRNGVEALIDMYLLAECDALIFPADSTFSLISSILSDADIENKFDITRRDVAVRAKRIIRKYLP
ncbi:MAG TPA: hypothetical protein DEG92_03620 [Rikenellaceae bacterium]|nr:hypothetical protein [Rikenellaceae bacterium]